MPKLNEYVPTITGVRRYVEAKKQKTLCMQKQFKQLCSRCKFYHSCTTYNEYVDAWMELQKI